MCLKMLPQAKTVCTKHTSAGEINRRGGGGEAPRVGEIRSRSQTLADRRRRRWRRLTPTCEVTQKRSFNRPTVWLEVRCQREVTKQNPRTRVQPERLKGRKQPQNNNFGLNSPEAPPSRQPSSAANNRITSWVSGCTLTRNAAEMSECGVLKKGNRQNRIKDAFNH